MTDIAAIIRDAAHRGHQVVCVHGEQCPGPSDMEIVVACAVLNRAAPQLFKVMTREITAVHTAMQNGHGEPGALDATASAPEDLLRQWFHWWRTLEQQPTMPEALHIQTVAYLATRAVEAGRVLRSPADV